MIYDEIVFDVGDEGGVRITVGSGARPITLKSYGREGHMRDSYRERSSAARKC